MPDAPELTACPGCGALLPTSDWPVDHRRNASPACWERYTQVLAHEAESMIELGRLHQLTVDTYAAQHPGLQVPAIAIPFALIGLHLALEQGWSGIAVRGAHGWLAQHLDAWPVFEAPPTRGPMSAADVADATSPARHAALVDRWAAVTWDAWQAQHDAVRSWAADVLPADLSERLRRETAAR